MPHVSGVGVGFQMTSAVAQNRHTQKVDLSNRCHAMIHHQNADAMVLASACLRGIPQHTISKKNINLKEIDLFDKYYLIHT